MTLSRVKINAAKNNYRKGGIVMNSSMLDVKGLSEYLSISSSLIRKLVRNKGIPYNRIGAKLLFSKNEIDSWLKENSHFCEYERRNY